MKIKNKCPGCRSERCVSVDPASDGMFSTFISHGFGRVDLYACLDCGTVYLDADDRRRINRNIKNREKRLEEKVDD